MVTVYTHTYSKILGNGLSDVQKFTVCIYPLYTRYFYNGQEITRLEYCKKTDYYDVHSYKYELEKKEV